MTRRSAIASTHSGNCRSGSKHRRARHGTDMNLQAEFDGIDIYLFDQLLKGRIGSGDRVLDAGCGSGRNLSYLLRSGIDVSATDVNPHAIEEVRQLAARLAPGLPPDRFRVEPVEQPSFPDAS